MLPLFPKNLGKKFFEKFTERWNSVYYPRVQVRFFFISCPLCPCESLCSAQNLTEFQAKRGHSFPSWHKVQLLIQVWVSWGIRRTQPRRTELSQVALILTDCSNHWPTIEWGVSHCNHLVLKMQGVASTFFCATWSHGSAQLID